MAGRWMALVLGMTTLPSACAVQGGGPGVGAGGGDAHDDGQMPAAPDCEGPLGAPQDPANLPSCCSDVGDSHCITLPAEASELGSFVRACAGGGHCVPDRFIETGGVFEPRSCTSVSNEPGACLSRCIPEVAENAGALPQDVCDDSELCVPCVSPLDGQDTGACDVGFSCTDGPTTDPPDEPTAAGCPHEGAPFIDPASFDPCPSCGGGHCVPNSAVAADLVGSLAACTTDQLCVPDEFIETLGNYIPETCESVAGSEGRCLSTCLPDVAAQAGQLPQSSCAANHVCVPCYDPLDLTPTGACDVSCDPGPTEPAQGLPKCCSGIGTCVPSASVPSGKADKLQGDGCPQEFGAMLCAPDVFITNPNYKPASCETFLVSTLFGDEYKPGACLPECLDGVDSFLLGQDGCPGGFKCAPCLEPPFGQSSGACDL